MDPNHYVQAGERMQELGKRIGLGILSVGFALFVLLVLGALAYSAFS